ncbi:hypothetical protein [Mycolicibacterium septicum]|uniref:hypothetical protein n=1 Tax=Mycolicibacterium septicum TaxID=98668 RepID=UPI001AF16ABA|nr:hypothetical protein [Mycolicibacterium septicum]QRY51780.1 hypothetical protein JVX95_31140 [Mycolicibacterium septicum]
MNVVLIALGIVAYVTVGLFVSREVWRRLDTSSDNIDAELNTVGVFLFWPTAIIGAVVITFIKWFYRERE